MESIRPMWIFMDIRLRLLDPHWCVRALHRRARRTWRTPKRLLKEVGGARKPLGRNCVVRYTGAGGSALPRTEGCGRPLCSRRRIRQSASWRKSAKRKQPNIDNPPCLTLSSSACRPQILQKQMRATADRLELPDSQQDPS